MKTHILCRFGSLLGLTCFALSSHAASFDCQQARSLVEQTVCSNAKVSALDDALDEKYRNAQATTVDALSLKGQQRKWVSDVRNRCSDVSCLTTVYQERIAVLTAAADEGLVVPSSATTGTYEMNGTVDRGQLQVFYQIPTKARFALHAENQQRNGNVNIGDIEGSVQLQGKVGAYVDGDCHVELRFYARKIVVKHFGDCGLGMGVNGSGAYVFKSNQIKM